MPNPLTRRQFEALTEFRYQLRRFLQFSEDAAREPADDAHFAMSEDEPVIVLISGTGPTSTVYENSQDDPSTKR